MGAFAVPPAPRRLSHHSMPFADRVASGTDQHAIARGDGAGVERQHELAPGAPRRGGASAPRVVARLAVDDPRVARPDRTVARAGRRGFGRVAHAVAAHGRGRSAVGRARRRALRRLAHAVAAHRRRRSAVGRTRRRALRRLAHAVAAHRRRRAAVGRAASPSSPSPRTRRCRTPATASSRSGSPRAPRRSARSCDST